MIRGLLNRGIVINLAQPIKRDGPSGYPETVTRVRVSLYKEFIFNESVTDIAGGGLTRIGFRKAVSNIVEGKGGKIEKSTF